MKRSTSGLPLACIMLCATATLAPTAFAETEMIPVTGSLVTSELTGTVTVVDLERRMLTIRTPEGPFEVIHVPDQVTRLDQVKIGNKLTISQTEAVVVDLQKGPAAGSVSVTKETVTERDPGRKPGGTIIDTMTRSGRVEAVDKVNSKVTVRGPTQTQTFTVRDPALLKEVAVGDGVVLTYMRVIRGEVKFK
ncbi:hypothetical protein CCR95_02520 [Thiocystis minor]|uniref:copper-binding protein n=1 Tax=Thiocystis minor TaxID=61597 RepID=UPI001911E5D7|nr:copper-binding protein [Thiocystis minor]MBK5962994.1 hypothetical protein [Thiocystis minor]